MNYQNEKTTYKWPFDFSVVMAAYQVEDYLGEAIESLISQTIGFKRIQLILVDDGSSDRSGEICDKYKAQYPHNIVVIHKANGGVASARNVGLQYATGRFINFMDADDKFSPNTFEEVYSFFVIHEEETDICCVPIFFFGRQEGEHWQNKKFRKGNRVVDLLTEFKTPLMFTNSSFFANKVKEKIHFDSHLVCGEDTRVIFDILIEKETLGVVSSGKYLYRRRDSDSNPSLIQSSKKKRGWYDDYFTYLVDYTVNIYMQKYGHMPSFVQYTLLSDLSWRFKENYEREMRLVFQDYPDAIDRYRNRLLNESAQFDDQLIVDCDFLYKCHKYMILAHKYGHHGSLVLGKNEASIIFEYIFLGNVSQMYTSYEFLTHNADTNTLILEGYHALIGLDNESIIPYVTANNIPIVCEIIKRTDEDQIFLGQKTMTALGFRVKIPILSKSVNIESAICIKGEMVYRTNIHVGQFFPITTIYKNAYYSNQSKTILFDKHILCFSTKWEKPKNFIREFRLLKELWRANEPGGRKAVFGRLAYHLVKPFKRRKLWIVSDRIMKADDNGEALFHYLMANRPRNTRILFAISKKSIDAERMAKIGPCVDAMSFRHKFLHLLCDVNISSQADDVTVNPYSGHNAALQDLLVHQKFVFLQHGVIKDDISAWLNRYNKNIIGFVTAAIPEYDSIVSGNYSYSSKNIWLTGLPRFDRLYQNTQKAITLMPTWRRYLMASLDSKTSVWKPRDDFETSSYFQFYSRLLNSAKLLDFLETHGYTLQFFPHPNLRLAGIDFQHDPRVEILASDVSYRNIYATSSLVLTDYSSVVFDFAYLRKPLIYCQFDKDEFFSGDHVYTQGYFDYERDGFGEVEYDVESTIDRIIEYVENDCELKPVYRERIDNFFAFHDQNNCKRVVEKIMNLQENN